MSNVRSACYRSALRIVIDLHLLASAIALARHGNYAHAADALHLSQPALSRQIAALEALLGVRLFDRGRKGAEPTAFGRMLLERAEPLLSDAADLERSIRLMQGLEAGEVSVGTGLYPGELSLGSAIGRLVSRHPGLRVDVTIADWRELIDGVLGKRFDLAVAELAGMTRIPRLALEPFPRHAGVFFCRAGHPLLDDRGLTLRRALAFPLVGPRMPARVHRLFARYVKGGTVDRETGDYVPPIKTEGVGVAKSVVASSDAIGFAPLALIAPEIEAGTLAPLPLHLPWLHTNYGVIRLKGRELSPAAQVFVAELTAVEAEVTLAEQALLTPRRNVRRVSASRPSFNRARTAVAD